LKSAISLIFLHREEQKENEQEQEQQQHVQLSQHLFHEIKNIETCQTAVRAGA
jgi:hypothetical protein